MTKQKYTKSDVFTERVAHSGAWIVSAFVDDGDGEYLKRTTFYFSTKAEAISDFLAELNQE